MALITTEYCRECEAYVLHTNGECVHCTERKRRVELALWQSKTTDEKLLDLHKRLKSLEAGPIRY